MESSGSRRISSTSGKFLEAVALQELCKAELEPNREIFYWRNATDREVDFILREGAEVKQLIHVVYASSRSEIEEGRSSHY